MHTSNSKTTPKLDFVAIDFETATREPHSACALGMVNVVNGDTAGHKWLIQPPGNFYESNHTMIHGVRSEHTAQSPTFDKVWPEIRQIIEGRILVAHNMSFDLKVLRASHSYYFPDEKRLETQYGCSLRIARLCYPQRSSHGLSALCEDWGIQLNHHDPLSDAKAVASIMSRMVIQRQQGLKELIALSENNHKQARMERMADKPPSQKQLDYLADLLLEDGHHKHYVSACLTMLANTNMAKVSRCIDKAKNGKRITVEFDTKAQMKQATGLRKPTSSIGQRHKSVLTIGYRR